jgi:hypothetical protein
LFVSDQHWIRMCFLRSFVAIFYVLANHQLTFYEQTIYIGNNVQIAG